ncbi:MAG: hypothetical protein AABY64_03695 [Bdellovibrionota bacterium]
MKKHLQYQKPVLALFVSAIFLSLTSACSKESIVSGVTTLPSSGSGTTGVLTDVKRIVTTGKGLNFNNQVGGPSEIKLHPTTKLPSVVYYDKTQQVGTSTSPAGALKYAYMDSSGNWNVEIVDGNTGSGGCGSATGYCIGAPNVAAPAFANGQPQMFDMQFSAGVGGTTPTPYIIYAYGTTTAKSIRIATRNMTTGQWTIADAVPTSSLAGYATATLEYSIKGIRLVFDASDRPHVYFARYPVAVASVSFVYYTMRLSAGTWTTPVSTTISIATAGAAAAAPVGVTQAGAVQCGLNDRTIISYGVADGTPATSYQPQVTRCSAVDANGTCTAWTNLDLITGCAGTCFSAMAAATTNAGQRSDLTIDPVTNKIIFAMYSTAIPATTAVAAIQPGVNDCQAFSTTAWSAQTAAAVNYGSFGVKVLASTSNVYLALMDGTAFTARLAQTSASLASAFTAGNTLLVETSATAVDGAGIAYDSTTDSLWATYATLSTAAAGVVGSDLRAAVAFTSDIVSTGTISTTTIDQTLNSFPATAAPVLSAAKAPNGTIGYAYFYNEPGATAGVNSHLYYGVRGGPVSAPVFGDNLVYNALQGAGANLIGSHPSLAYDSASNPVITFLDAGTAPANTGALMIARSSSGGAYFSVDRVDGIGATPTVGRFNSVDLTSTDVVGISYYDYTAGNLRLKFARKGASSSAWKKYIVDGLSGGTCTGTVDAGSYSSFKWTSDGRPVIVYQATVGSIKTLRIAYATEASTSATYTWSCLSLDTSGQGVNARGEGIDFVLDANNVPHIVHFDSTVGGMRYITCGSAISTCMSTGVSAFTAEQIELTGTVTVISSRPSIKVDSSGKRWVSFYGQAYGAIRLSTKASGASSWSIEQLETNNSGSSFVSGAGQYGNLIINSSGYPMLFYRSLENWVRYFSRELL